MDTKLNFLRTYDSTINRELLEDIVDEGVDIFDVCEYSKVDEYINQVINSSALTFLYHWFDGKEKFFPKYNKEMIKIIEDKYYFQLYHYFFDSKNDKCVDNL